MFLFKYKVSAWLSLLLLILWGAAPQIFAIVAPAAIVWYIMQETNFSFGLAMFAIAAVATDKLTPAYQNGFTLTKIGLQLDTVFGVLW